MKELKLYIAYDDEEFTDKEECLAYEQKAWDMINDIKAKLEFYDVEGEPINIPETDDIEEAIDMIDETINKSGAIRVLAPLKEDMPNKIRNIFSFGEDLMFLTGQNIKEPHLFLYNDQEMKWEQHENKEDFTEDTAWIDNRRYLQKLSQCLNDMAVNGY